MLWSLGSLPELLFADCQSGMRAAGRMSPRAVEAARVRKVWSEVRAVFGNAYDFVDFVNQDDEVARRTNKTALAIELAVKKEVG